MLKRQKMHLNFIKLKNERCLHFFLDHYVHVIYNSALILMLIFRLNSQVFSFLFLFFYNIDYRLFSPSQFAAYLKSDFISLKISLLARHARSGALASGEQMCGGLLQAYLAGRGGSALPATSQEERW